MTQDEPAEKVLTQTETGHGPSGRERTEPRPNKGKGKIVSTYALPVSSPEALSKILKAYVIASRQGETSVKYTDVAAVCGVAPTKVSANNGFLAQSGFITTDRYGYYRPSPQTTKFAKQAPWDENGAKKFIREQIGPTWYGETIKQQFQMYSALSRDQQIKALGIKSTPDLSDANKLELLFDFLVYFDYVVQDDQGNYSLRPDGASAENEVDQTTETMISAVQGGESPSTAVDRFVARLAAGEEHGATTPHVNINISISPQTTDEELELVAKKTRHLLDAIRRGVS